MKKIYILILLLILSASLQAEIKIADCEADKVVYKNGEVAEFYADITSDRDTEAILTWYLYKDLDKKIPFKVQHIELKKDQITPCTSYLKIEEDWHWGYEAEAEVTDYTSSAEPVKGHIYFAVGDNTVALGHYGNICNRGIYTKDQALDSVRLAFKRNHCSTWEWFSWQPSCWETMAPPEDEWVSGQTGFIEKKDYIKSMIDLSHELGMKCYTYDIKYSWGYKGAEFIRQHFDWWNYDKFGNPFPEMNTYDISVIDDTLNYLKTGQYECRVSPQWVWWDSGVILNKEMQELYLNQIKECIEMFGWDGVRQDGIAVYHDTYDREGKTVKADRKFKDHPTWIRYVRKWMKDNISPETELHFNAGSVSYPLEKGDPKIFEAMAEDGSYVLWEGVTYSFQKTNELNNMKTLIKYANMEAKASRDAGGYRFAMQGLGTNEILEACFTACGIKAQTLLKQDPPTKENGPLYRDFDFRYGAYFWDNTIKHIDHAKDFISVDNENVYWEDTVQCLEKGDKTYYMVHLLNPASDWSATTWPEKYHKDFNVTINTDKKVRAYILSPDFGADNSFRIDCGETKTVNVPYLAVWDVVIFETEK